MITRFKLFENINTQEPFFLFSDTLYISDEMAHKMTPTFEELSKKGQNKGWTDFVHQNNIDFYSKAKDVKGYTKSNRVYIDITVRYGGKYYDHYSMDLNIRRANIQNNEFGHFEYYINGISGDKEMHEKNMIKITRECNLHLMEKYYPIVKNIKNFYKKMQKKEGFFNIIKTEILKDYKITKDGVPEELEDEFGHMYNANKYNL